MYGVYISEKLEKHEVLDKLKELLSDDVTYTLADRDKLITIVEEY